MENIPDCSSVLNIIDRAAKEIPEKLAVVFEGKTMTYRELNLLTNQLAHHLLSKGVKEEMMVPICMDRSLEMIIGILGILKAGGAYVPIDPRYPQLRIQQLFQETNASIVLTHQQTTGEIAEIADTVELLEWEKIKPVVATLPESTPQISLKPEHLAYVIFTSGSTGQPKGVLVEHAQLFNATEARCTYYRSFGNVLLVPSFAFDASLATIFGSLCSGGCLIICRQEDLQHPLRLIQLLPQLDTLLCVPSYYQFLLEGGLLTHTKLSQVILGGEAISPSLVASHFEKNGKANLYNEYGPTETTIWATVDHIKSVDSPITIGWPIKGVSTYVLGPEGQLVEENTMGELYIGGQGLARGYLNDPEGTAAHFVDPPIGTSSSRLYKTGDLCYRLPDERIVFVGRTDSQVKISGYRIEMGQIESALCQIAGVRQAAVLAKESKHGVRYLVAFIQLSALLSTKSLRAQLQDCLPDYMIPNLWIQLDELPLTPNGKLDRQALQAYEVVDGADAPFTNIIDPLEASLLSLWQKYLPTPHIGVDDDFFELGGNSLMAMSLVAALRRERKLDLNVSTFFQQPTIAKLAHWIEAMPDSGTGQVERETGSQTAGAYPLSYGQESFWLIDQLGESRAYHLPLVLRVAGELNVEALTWSIRKLLQRHEALRTTLRGEKNEKHQYLLSANDWRFAPAAQELHPDTLEELISQPFDLSSDFMLRAWLFSAAPNENTLLFVVHHVAFDAWSKHIFLEELWSGYHAFITNTPLLLPPLTTNYRTYALRQRSEPEFILQKLTYWKDKLQGFSTLQLPKDHFAPKEPTEGGSKTFFIPPDLLAQIRDLSRHQGATVFMTFLAAFKVLLHRYSSQEDILVGTAIAGREEPETESLIGYFVNSLPLRTEVRGAATFLEILRNVKQTTLEAYDAKQVPFEKIVAQTGIERQAWQNPLFQVMFNFQNVPQPNLKTYDGLAVSLLDIPQTTSKFDLTFSLSDAGDGIKGEVEFRTGRYRPSTIDRMIQHYLLLLKNVIQQPSTSVGKLDIIGEEEQQLLHAFNQNSKSYPKDETILDLIKRQVKKAPGNTAAIFGDQHITYKTLDDKSNQLAHLLRERGAREETLVLVCMRRSLDLIVALIGILKSGAAYVPIDPAYPQQRKNFIIEDTAAQLAVTDFDNLKELSGIPANGLIVLEEGASNLSGLDQHETDAAIQPEQLAYVIYTSGSTGRPKGVMIEHRNVHAFISWCKEEFSSSSFKVVYTTTSICFDLSVFEIFYPLSTGTPFRLLQDGLEIKHYLPQDDHIMINTVPSVVRQLLEEEVDLSNVSVLNMAGEPINKSILDQLDVEKIEVRNLYGPTEDTTYSTVYRVGKEREVLIGRPISNTAVHIIDQEHRLNPIGIPGEICLSGSGLARGYFNRPDFTEERFVFNPFTPTSGDVMYKTGDVGRWLPNGQIEFIGRKDDQVKIRGYRIELGEIEKALQQYPGIRQAIVLAKMDLKEHCQLVGYLAMDGPLDKYAVMDFLKQQLPFYMVPALWIKVDTFPLTPNGKIDKKKLPDPLRDGFMDHAFVAPRNELETTLAGIWEEVLQVERVGVHDDFFSLGGTSLLVTRLLAATQNAYDINFNIRDLFAFPTIAGLTRNFDFHRKTSSAPAIRSVEPRPESLPLSYNQESLWFIDQLNGSRHYHIPLVLKLEGPLDYQAIDRSLRGIIERHEVLRTVIRHDEGRPHQVVKDTSDWRIERIDLQSRHHDPDEIQKIVVEIIDHPFDLSCDYMLKASLIQLGPTQHILEMVVHHIAFDGWSNSLLLNELAISYKHVREGRAPELETLPFQYADFAVWQKHLVHGDLLRRKSDYWKKKLLNLNMLQLPVDFPKPPVPNFNGSVETLQIDKALRDQLSKLAQEQSATLFMTLLTAFKMLLSHYSGQQDICVGTVTTGRHQKELEKLIGYFVQTLPIRSNLTPDATFLDMLKEVKTNTLEAFENQELPFEKIVASTQARRKLGEHPLFQVVFLFQNFPESGSFSLGDVTMTHQPVKQNTSKFDLSFIISELASGLEIDIEYSLSLFKRSTVNRFGRDYIRLLKQIVSDPQLKFSQFFQKDAAQIGTGTPMEMETTARTNHFPPDLDHPKQSDLTSSQEKIATIWRSALRRTTIGIDENFFELGGRSPVAVDIMSQLESQFGTSLRPSILLVHPTIKGLAQVIEQEGETDKYWKSLLPIKPTGIKPPLYLVLEGGADIVAFYSIVNKLDKDQPVYGLQVSGWDGNGPPLEPVESIASLFIREMLNHNPNKPIHLAGYAWGGIIAFEMAQQLKAMGKEAHHVVIINTFAEQSDYGEKWTTRLKNRVKRNIEKRVLDLYSSIRSPKVKRDSLNQELTPADVDTKSENGIPESDLMKTIRNIGDNHREAFENYILKPYDGKIHLIKLKISTSPPAKVEFAGWHKYVKHVEIEEMEGELSASTAGTAAHLLQKILDTK